MAGSMRCKNCNALTLGIFEGNHYVFISAFFFFFDIQHSSALTR